MKAVHDSIEFFKVIPTINKCRLLNVEEKHCLFESRAIYIYKYNITIDKYLSIKVHNCTIIINVNVTTANNWPGHLIAENSYLISL